MHRIGNYCLDQRSGQWRVLDRHGAVVVECYNKWSAIREARDLNWRDAHEKKRPPVQRAETGGSEEPKSKWRWSYIGGTHG